MAKRLWKLQDYVAHAGEITCARFGEKSGQVLATGGEDKKVNIWKVGKPNALMSLQGHTSAVECIVFDKQEEVLVVGCSGGSIQVWNLDYRKVHSTMTGHRTACGAVEFHPYGEFFASGSADTNLKIWDSRRKGCIQTYKGHAGPIHTIRFSPHGRWVATGGQDHQVKLWDLTAGKLMRDLDVHKGPITSIAFHPKEYLLATGSADRTMKMWNLESFQTVGSTDLGSTPVEAVKFWPEEQSIVAASQDAVRVYSLDSLSTAQDACDVEWRGLRDLRLCANEEKLLSLSTEGTKLSIWVTELSRRDAVRGAGYGRLNARCAHNAAPARHPQASRRQAAPNYDLADPEPLERKVSNSVPTNGDDQHERGPRTGAASPCLAGQHGIYPTVAQISSHPPSRLPSSKASSPSAPQSDGSTDGPTPPSSVREPHMYSGGIPGASSLSGSYPGQPHRPHSAEGSTPVSRMPTAQPRRPEISTEQLIAMSGQHTQMRELLERRMEQMRKLRDIWTRGNVQAIGTVINGPNDHAVFCDFARAMLRKNVDSLNLDACQAFLPILCDLLGSKYDDFVFTALDLVAALLQNFQKLIRDTRASCGAIPERQLDFAREERLQKCDACFASFSAIHKLFPESRVGDQFSSLKANLEKFLQS